MACLKFFVLVFCMHYVCFHVIQGAEADVSSLAWMILRALDTMKDWPSARAVEVCKDLVTCAPNVGDFIKGEFVKVVRSSICHTYCRGFVDVRVVVIIVLNITFVFE